MLCVKSTLIFFKTMGGLVGGKTHLKLVPGHYLPKNLRTFLSNKIFRRSRSTSYCFYVLVSKRDIKFSALFNIQSQSFKWLHLNDYSIVPTYCNRCPGRQYFLYWQIFIFLLILDLKSYTVHNLCLYNYLQESKQVPKYGSTKAWNYENAFCNTLYL